MGHGLCRLRRDRVGRPLMPAEIVGRDEELATVATFLSSTEPGPAALVLEGEPGIGESTIWLKALELARADDLRTLVSRPAQAEVALVHAGLGDLLDDVLDETLSSLAPPRRRALSLAMLRDEAPGEAVDRRAVALAVRDVLALLGEPGPILVAIDDVQWLDASSTSALMFALRRLPTSRVLLLLTRRSSIPSSAPKLEDALAPQRIRRVPVGPLSVGALHRLLRDRLSTGFSRHTMRRVLEQSGGNPFFAIELGRTLKPDAGADDPLPLPETLDVLLRARLAGLPPATRESLAFAAAYGTVPESLLGDAGIDLDVFRPAIDAQVIERRDGTIRFTHPLLASVLYGDLGAARSRVHAEIARLAVAPTVRARHLALATAHPDSEVADELDAAARLAIDRGAAPTGAELAEHAVRLTPWSDEELRWQRTIAAARAHQLAGDWSRARDLAEALLAEERSGSRRAEVLMLLADLRLDRTVPLLREALREAESPSLRAVILCRLAWAARFESDADHAGQAVALAAEVGDEELLTRARAISTVVAWFTGRAPTSAVELLTLTRHLASSVGGERLVQEATLALVNTLAPKGVRDRAQELLTSEQQAWQERNELRSAQARWGLAWLELWAGRWGIAADHAEQAHDIASEYGQEIPQDLLPAAVVALHRGRLDTAREYSTRALALSRELFGDERMPQHHAVLGLVARWSGDPSSEALDRLAAAERWARTLTMGEPSLRWWTADHVEALLQADRADEAVRLLDRWAADAGRTSRTWVLAQVTRTRGLVAAADGDITRAIGLLEQAVSELHTVGDPFGTARARLALGAARRRAKQKAQARQDTLAALETFDAVGAALWADRARAELSRIGGRTRARGLTAAESRVVDLAVQGRTNREIATALFLGERTVATHLTHVYAKLGVRSRTELAGRLRAAQPQ